MYIFHLFTVNEYIDLVIDFVRRVRPDMVLERGLLNPEGVFVLEHGRDNDFSLHPRFVEHRTYGSVNFSLFQ